MDNSKARDIQTRALEALKIVFKEQGIAVRMEGGQVGGDFATLRFRFDILDASGASQAEKDTLKFYGGPYGLTEAMFGRKFFYNGKWWKLRGINTQAIRYPISAERADTGRLFKLPPAAAEACKNALP